MILEGSDGVQYAVGKLVGSTAEHRLYLCTYIGQSDQGVYLMQVAISPEHNGGLDRAVYHLNRLVTAAVALDANEYLISGQRPRYDRLFPLVIESLVLPNQDGRRVNILGFVDVPNTTQLVPLSSLVAKHQQRIDLKTSAWIMGRLLKLLAWIHDKEKLTIRKLDGSNILLEPAQHFAIVFDWSAVLTHQDEVPVTARKDDIAAAAQAVFAAIGGDLATGAYEYPADEGTPYVEYLWRLASRRQGNAQTAHGQFYELVDRLWGREFHPFTPLPL